MIFFLKTQAGWRETSQVEHMLRAEPDITPDSAFQKLKTYLEAIGSRQQAAPLVAEPEPMPIEHSESRDG